MPPYLMHQDDATQPAKPANENDVNLYRSTRAFIRARLFRVARSDAPVYGGLPSRHDAPNRNDAPNRHDALDRHDALAGTDTPSRSNAPDWSKR